MGIGSLFSRGQSADDAWDDGTATFAEPTPSTPIAPLLTPQHVHNVRFHTAKPGYAFTQVEAFVQQVADTLQALEAEAATSDAVLREAHEELAHLREQVIDLQNTIEVFRAKGDVLVGADGTYVTESQLADVAALTAERDTLLSQAQEWADAYQALEAQFHTLEAQHAEMASRPTAEHTVDHDALEEQAAALRAAEASNIELQASATSLRSQIADLTAALTQAQENAARLEAEAQTRDASPSADTIQMLEDAAALVRSTQEELAQTQASLMDARADVETARAELANAQTQLNQAQDAAEVPEPEEDIAALKAALAAAIDERDEALLAESELRAYVDETLAAWMQTQANTPTPVESDQIPPEEPITVEAAPVDMSDDEDVELLPDSIDGDDEGWGDAPVANAPEVPGGVIPPANVSDAATAAHRAHAPLIDAPELRRPSSN